MRYLVAIALGLVVGFAIATYVVEPAIASTKYSIELSKQVDSLQTELFIKGAELGRYQIALELFKEEDSVGADHFEYILNTQTEQL